MIQVCTWCTMAYGEKHPLEDTSMTHGICAKCLTKVMRERRLHRNATQHKQESKLKRTVA